MSRQLDIFGGVPAEISPPAPAAPPPTYIHAGADVSACGRYRWTLTRRWSATGWTLVWIMLNPSTADGREDDPTVRRCVGFARREGAGAIAVVNLFAWRATDPRELLAFDERRAIGDRNDDEIRAAVGRDLPVVAAWGAHPAAARRAERVIELVGRPVLCLGTTKDGAPRHPLYVRGDQPLVEFRP